MALKKPQLASPFFTRIDQPFTHRSAEYVEGEGWYHGGHRLRKVKTHKHLIWPKDGRNGSTWGRCKDILRGTGPDIHVAFSADRMDHLWNRQKRARWSGHTNLDDRGPDSALRYKLPWISLENATRCYDFRTRTYGRPNREMWTDARWPEEPNNEFVYPYAMRDIRGEWIQYSPDAFEHGPYELNRW